MDKKSISESIDEYTNSVLETPTTLQEFNSPSPIFPNYPNTLPHHEPRNSLYSKRNDIDIDEDYVDETLSKNPFQFF